MVPSRPTIDPTYRNFAELLLRRHRLLLEGKETGSEIDALEDDLSATWEKLDDAQRQSLNGAAADLNWVRRGGVSPPQGRRAEEVTQHDRQQLAEAEAAKDWHAVLHHLRACAPVMDVNELAWRRAAAYAGVDLPAYEMVYRKLLTGLGQRHVFAHPIEEDGGDGIAGTEKVSGTDSQIGS